MTAYACSICTACKLFHIEWWLDLADWIHGMHVIMTSLPWALPFVPR